MLGVGLGRTESLALKCVLISLLPFHNIVEICPYEVVEKLFLSKKPLLSITPLPYPKKTIYIYEEWKKREYQFLFLSAIKLLGSLV